MKSRIDQEKRDLLAQEIWDCRKAIQREKRPSTTHWARGYITGYMAGLSPSHETLVQVVRILRGMRLFGYPARD